MSDVTDFLKLNQLVEHPEFIDHPYYRKIWCEIAPKLHAVTSRHIAGLGKPLDRASLDRAFGMEGDKLLLHYRDQAIWHLGQHLCPGPYTSKQRQMIRDTLRLYERGSWNKDQRQSRFPCDYFENTKKTLCWIIFKLDLKYRKGGPANVPMEEKALRRILKMAPDPELNMGLGFLWPWMMRERGIILNDVY